MFAFNAIRCRATLLPMAARCAIVMLIASLSAGAAAVTVNGSDGSEPPASRSDSAEASSKTTSGVPEFRAGYDPFEEHSSGAHFSDVAQVVYDPFDELPIEEPVTNPATADNRELRRRRFVAEQRTVRPIQLAAQEVPYRLEAQQSEELPVVGAPTQEPNKDPCAAVAERPLGELTINIQMPQGDLPEDFAAACREERESKAGPFAHTRAWPMSTYHWNATCFCHRPLYFEEINLERYGYGCHPCLQPAASAAHFFATVPALPYCMAAECPGECSYTLRHYRPGSCPPWRCHYPPYDRLAAATEAGVLTGLIFLIP